jgi:hypothetical protein
VDQTLNGTPHMHREDTPAEVEQFNRVAKTGWDFFTKFLLWNVLAIIAILLFIGVLTVWS